MRHSYGCGNRLDAFGRVSFSPHFSPLRRSCMALCIVVLATEVNTWYTIMTNGGKASGTVTNRPVIDTTASLQRYSQRGLKVKISKTADP